MNRVVVTGLGAVTPLGNNVKDFWNGLKEGKNAIDFIKSFDNQSFKAKLAAEVDINIEDYLDKKEARRMDRFTQFALIAANEAVLDSGINVYNVDKYRFGVVLGSGVGGIKTLENEHTTLLEKGPGRVSPYFIPMMISNLAAGNIAIKFGAKGIANTVVTACASGTNAIGEAFRLIKSGILDVAITGGTEAAITPLALAGFSSLKALSFSEDKNRASIPFDKEREGFVMGEGSGILILESLEHALERGAKIYAEVVGYGATCDAYHITAPVESGEGAACAMEMAIKEAGIDITCVDYINAHGTSTPYNDKIETTAIKKVFKDHAYKLAVNSTKSMIGHLLGAAGAVEAIVCVKSVQEDFVHPTINLNVKDEECDLDYVPHTGRSMRVNYALSNSLGFGGHNASILLKKWEG
ncbi:beta-ketoacyl-ACP synthase II [Caloramator proteoclasticus]|uniref:3-oxoacyl-[acyl-carrier-protein] synthase 2 n=1 Tax=Caloramator proteoclasticus DSM 10124 TaxID=1121262 RepID=A0A1M5AYR3_9CLOT|nr:beta-ketoacyl-ACP synthase II [Caloramator proteoclasticus]SHF35350.1 3-oxoacyl-[acyl-carrier-protein] synthase II [Caloramator proteoclasticus DSM 10124]